MGGCRFLFLNYEITQGKEGEKFTKLKENFNKKKKLV